MYAVLSLRSLLKLFPIMADIEKVLIKRKFPNHLLRSPMSTHHLKKIQKSYCEEMIHQCHSQHHHHLMMVRPAQIHSHRIVPMKLKQTRHLKKKQRNQKLNENIKQIQKIQSHERSCYNSCSCHTNSLSMKFSDFDK
ncbi:hypothetical protein RirG_188070 [Rhizophagus irregularis DAOM 197198w]|uniref:Uncharacterized protein n=1 Tax=Rhizophagus irregularis (strain DAOM 197198w) TaxID=1432141 RepID=A0A015IYS1_RHIIW|nr:hypothetical protein RirG_188070 [Rhizophagus irregularis DAOM 197198w]